MSTKALKDKFFEKEEGPNRPTPVYPQNFLKLRNKSINQSYIPRLKNVKDLFLKIP